MPYVIKYTSSPKVRPNYLHIPDMEYVTQWRLLPNFNAKIGKYLFTRDEALDILERNFWGESPALKIEFFIEDVPVLESKERGICLS